MKLKGYTSVPGRSDRIDADVCDALGGSKSKATLCPVELGLLNCESISSSSRKLGLMLDELVFTEELDTFDGVRRWLPNMRLPGRVRGVVVVADIAALLLIFS